MTKITPDIWLGDSKDAESADLKKDGIGAMLNVAHDLQCKRGWSDGIEYAQCGLVDGPGNTMASYHAALLKLCALVCGGRKTLVVDHVAGGRAVAVAIMGLHAMRRMGWAHWLKEIAKALAKVDEQGFSCVEVHPKHKEAFDRINWRLVSVAMEG